MESSRTHRWIRMLIVLGVCANHDFRHDYDALRETVSRTAFAIIGSS